MKCNFHDLINGGYYNLMYIKLGSAYRWGVGVYEGLEF